MPTTDRETERRLKDALDAATAAEARAHAVTIAARGELFEHLERQRYAPVNTRK